MIATFTFLFYNLQLQTMLFDFTVTIHSEL